MKAAVFGCGFQDTNVSFYSGWFRIFLICRHIIIQIGIVITSAINEGMKINITIGSKLNGHNRQISRDIIFAIKNCKIPMIVNVFIFLIYIFRFNIAIKTIVPIRKLTIPR